ncbi:hypothetical protein [Bradyrhizobium sp. URHC0002]
MMQDNIVRHHVSQPFVHFAVSALTWINCSVCGGKCATKIRSVLRTMKQVAIDVAQAQQWLLARGAQDLRDAMYKRERLDTMIDLAGNVTKLRA